MKSVRTPKPRSPLTSITRGSCAAISPSARTKAARIRLLRAAAELQQRGFQLCPLRAPVMPQHLMLHEGYAAPLDRVGDDNGRPIRLRPRMERGAQGAMIVAVDALDGPAERSPLVRERLQRKRVLDGREALELVIIDDRTEVGEAMVRRKQRRFPDRPFVAFAVAEQHEDALAAAHATKLHRHAGADAEPMAERAGRERDARHILVADVARQVRSIAVMRAQLLDREETAFGECCVDAGPGVPLG